MNNLTPKTPKRTTEVTTKCLDGRPITWAPVRSRIKKRKHRKFPASARKQLFTDEPDFHLCLSVNNQQEIEIGWTNSNGEIVVSNESPGGPRIITFIPLVIGTLSNELATEISLIGNRDH